MNTKYFLTGCLIILISVSCKSAKGKAYENSQTNSLSLGEPVMSKEVLGKVVSIDLSQKVYEILIEDNSQRKYKILSKKVTTGKQNNEIAIGKIYKFNLVQLTHLNVNQSRTMTVDDKEITISPNHYIQDCIKFNGQKFCNDSWELYECLNLTNLNINN